MQHIQRLINMKRTLLIVSVFLMSVLCAQDPSFSQLNYGWAMLNPAYAGSLGCARAEMGYRNQWPGITGTFITFNASYDQLFSFGGAGFNYMHDAAGMGTLKTDRFDFNYSYPIGIGTGDDNLPKIVIQPGVQASYQRKTVDWAKLNYGDMIDPRRGFVYNTTETPATNAKNIFDVSVGMIAYTKRICIGLSTFHLTQPDEGFVGVSKLPMRYVANVSCVLFNADPNENGFSLIPSVVVMQQGDFDVAIGSLSAKYRGATLGVGYRNKDALIFIGGYSLQDFALSYSYDLTVSELTNATGGSHEVHLAYRFGKEKWSAERRNLQAFF